MKILILFILAALAFATPDKIDIVVKTENVAPKKPSRRDSLPTFAEALYFAKAKLEVEALETRRDKLSYSFDELNFPVVVRFDEWMRYMKPEARRKVFGRLNQVDADGNVLRTISSCFVEYGQLEISFPEVGFYKIALFQEGNYCNGIEYDFFFFSPTQCTRMKDFVHHQIVCE